MATIMVDETQYLTVCYTSLPSSNHSVATITRHKRSVKHEAILKATLYKNVWGGGLFSFFSSTKLKIPQLKCKKLIEQCVCVL